MLLRPILALFLLVLPAAAAEKILPLTSPDLSLEAAMGQQVTLRFSDAMTAKYFSAGTYQAITLSGIIDGKVCFYGPAETLNVEDPKFAPLLGPEGADICVAKEDASVVYDPQVVEGAPPQPFFLMDAKQCKWNWKTGKGIGLWVSDCDFGAGPLTITYNEAEDAFVQGDDPASTPALVRQFHKSAGDPPDSILPLLRTKGLIPNDDECKFADAENARLPAHWKAFEIVPTGKRKAEFDAAPQDEVPEPPCGEVGLAVDSVAYFMMDDRHPDRMVFVNLGQDAPPFDPTTITFF